MGARSIMIRVSVRTIEARGTGGGTGDVAIKIGLRTV